MRWLARQLAGLGPRPVALALVLALLGGTGMNATAQQSLESRLDRIERLLNPEALLRMHDGIEALKGEIRDLRGEIEVQRHTIEQLKRQQSELYVDIDERLGRVEAGETSAPAAGAAPAAPASGASAPATGSTQPAVAVAPTAPASTDTAAASTSASGQPPVLAASAAANRVPATAYDPVEEQNTYQGAFSLLKAGRYDKASKAFETYLETYPGGKFADNAQYWLGETHYVTGKFEPAMKEFQRLVASYPRSTKLTHALLKIGYIHHELGNIDAAERALKDLIARYPNETAAGLARKRLQRLRE